MRLSTKIKILFFGAIFLVWPFFPPVSCLALEADELLVVANRNARDSIALAEYYMATRGVPKQNLLKIFVTDAETCSREEYDQKIAQPIREKFEAYRQSGRPRCVVLMYGVPLRIGAVPLNKAEQDEILGLKAEQERLNDQLKTTSKDADRKQLKEASSAVAKKVRVFEWNHNTGASVDSELMLVPAAAYPLPMWVPNPFFMGFKDKKAQIPKNDVIMVSRLDGPSPDIVRRMIDDAITAEQKGLSGNAYFDARWQRPKEKQLGAYALYDGSLHLAADRVRKSGRLPVTVDDQPALFGPGDCPRAALYCGWYSLAKYVDAFDWRPGAIGYHIASAECTTLKRPDSQVWCKRMLEEGVAATIGPVAEPFVQAFPMPELFFGFLTDGYLTLAECYLLSLPYLSWKMVLIGDPLYQPFKAQLKK